MASTVETLTATQVRCYLERVCFDGPKSSATVPAPTLETLHRLVACHLRVIPFENLSLHYSTHRSIVIEKEFLLEKMVNKRKGGYCMEHNTIFTMVLRTLGYNLYTIAARVYLPNDSESAYPGGLIHMAIIVTIDGVEYLVDVGFGGNGLTAPLPIFDGDSIETPINGVLPEEHRVRKIELCGALKNGHKSWVLERRQDTQTKWAPVYVFEKDFEFFPADYEVINMFTSQNPQSLFVNNILCTNVVFNENLEAISRTILWNLVLKRRENGSTNIIKRFTTEEERITAIEGEFGVKLTQEEREGIKGSKVAVEHIDMEAQKYEF